MWLLQEQPWQGQRFFSLVPSDCPLFLLETSLETSEVDRHRLGLLGCPVQGQEWDWMILVGPFHLRMLCAPVIL